MPLRIFEQTPHRPDKSSLQCYREGNLNPEKDGMKMHSSPKRLLAAITVLAASASLHAQSSACSDSAAIAHLARAHSAASLKARMLKAGNSYRAQIIFAARSLEIDSGNKTAALALLTLLPKDVQGPQETYWLDLSGPDQCPSGGAPLSDLLALENLRDRLPADLAKAVLLLPSKLPEYLAYASIAIGDPHNDYAEQMQAVCKARHTDFLKAVQAMNPKDRAWFEKMIFHPNSCRAIALAEQ
jgi:hypothetical protein